MLSLSRPTFYDVPLRVDHFLAAGAQVEAIELCAAEESIPVKVAQLKDVRQGIPEVTTVRGQRSIQNFVHICTYIYLV